MNEKNDSLLDFMCRIWKLPSWWILQGGFATYCIFNGTSGWFVLGNFILAFIVALLVSWVATMGILWIKNTRQADKTQVVEAQLEQANAVVFSDWDRALLEQNGIIAESAGKPGYDEKGKLLPPVDQRRVSNATLDPYSISYTRVCSCEECQRDRCEEEVMFRRRLSRNYPFSSGSDFSSGGDNGS